MTQTVADLLIDTLAGLQVKRIYGVVGDSLNPVTDALQRRKDMQWVHMRHEEAAAFAAGAEAQLTGELAVCAGSCGPGNLHLINGLYDCHRSNAPVLAIAAHIPTGEIGSNYFQETHPQMLFKECSHFCEFITAPEQLPRMLTIALQTALNKRGVAVLVLSADVATKLVENTSSALWPRRALPRIIPHENELQKMATLLNEAKKVTLLCGYGCAEAREELLQLGNILKSPMVHALRGKEFVEYDNPYDVGMTGFIGFSSGYYAMEACDTLLILGANFPYQQFYPSHAKVIQVDINPEAIGRRCPVDIGVVGDVKSTLQALLPLLKMHNDQHLSQAVTHYHKSRQDLDALATGKAGHPIHPQYLAKMISQYAAKDAIFTCDVGTVTIWAARYLQMNGQRRLLGSFNHGSMANALSQAIGAQATYPQRQVIAMCGDGGFAMLMGDFISLLQLNIPVKVIIFNNSTLGFVELEMKAAGFLDTGTELKNPDFAAMAKAMGIYGDRVEDPTQLAEALQKFLAQPGPGLLDVVTNRQELSMPPKITLQQAKGFSLYMMKAILSGRGDEVLELAKTNLWR